MNSICFFATYIPGPVIPDYIKVYLNELKRHFNEVVFISEWEQAVLDKEHHFEKNGIKYLQAKNEGYDFGQWYDAITKYDVSKYDRLGFVNDSCVLFASLDAYFRWNDQSDAVYKGISLNHNFYPHIQSYFFIIEKPVITLVKDYFLKQGKKKTVTEVIQTYEVGLSNYITTNNFKIAAFLDNGNYEKEYSPYFYLVEKYLGQGMPMIKKKIILSSYRKDELWNLARMNFNIDPDHYIRLIRKFNRVTLLDPERMVEKNNASKLPFLYLRYLFLLSVVKFYRLFKK